MDRKDREKAKAKAKASLRGMAKDGTMDGKVEEDDGPEGAIVG